jgi:glycosyltransferase involved in cell wall biosynthesis
VVHVVLSLDCGGLERVVVDLVREGQVLGQRVAVVCLERPGALAPQVESLGAPVTCVEKGPGLSPATRRRLAAVLRDLRPDVVHTHQMGALFYAGPAAGKAGVAVTVHTEHGKHLGREAGGLLRRLRRSWLWWLAARSAARLFCVSEDIADSLAAGRITRKAKLCVLPNGIDTAKFEAAGDREAERRSLGIPARAPVIGTVGRLNEVKRQDLLLRAFAAVKGKMPDAWLLLVGGGPMRDALRGLAADLGVAGAVHFAGYQADPERFLRVMDVFALTSRSEGMPLALLEAWAAGLPVVASAVGGVPALIDEGRTGLLFPSGDAARLTEALGRVLLDGALARRLAEEGRREVVARFGLARMAAAYEGHYRELLGVRGGQAPCAF